jgi:hypothetical protein
MIFLLIVLCENYSVAAVYQWEDKKGVVHFTDNPETIPAKYRNSVKTDLKNDDSSPPSNYAIPPVHQQPDSSPPMRDIDKGEDYWRSRYALLRMEIKGLRDGFVVKKDQMNEFRRKWLVTQKRVERQSMNRLEDEIGRDEERIKELERQLESLDGEAARNAVPLEWRR